MRTKIGIVYDLMTGQVKRIIIPDEDWQLAIHSRVGFGEGFHIETYTGKSLSVEQVNAIVQRRTGKMLP